MEDILDGVDVVDGVDMMDSVGNSASSNFLPKQISSSLSSGLSVGSVKTRRPNAPSGLTLATPVQAITDSVAFQSELVNSKVEESWLKPNLTTKMVSPGPSPLYVEPWDSKWNICVHGHSGDGVCQTCEVEAELIVQQCNQWA